MNEVREQLKQELSSDINIITAEINAYKQVAGEAIFEIGRRLKHVRDVIFEDTIRKQKGDWRNFLRSVDFDITTAKRFIKVYEEFGEDGDTWHRLTMRVLYEIATLPPEERDKPHTTSKGEQKTPSEMTVRELRQLKADLKRAEEQRRQAEQQAELERKERERLEALANKPPEVRVETKTEYVEPDDYEDLRRENAELKSKYGVGVRRVSGENRAEFFREFANDLKYIYEKYGSVVIDAYKLNEFVEQEKEVGEKINEFDDFWNMFSKSVFKNTNIIEMESV
ncbi:DUF3102 domain-containing protein [Virgibacillus pantothenticus]|uniref:DUF3102 domain-containing protein n=1 Tax=Virgibacillus pantothenticus TaxID=1473 RepID=UPI0009854750|nr:DUF3102 domain-containing protein [Virgibacillus pantothenticus]